MLKTREELYTKQQPIQSTVTQISEIGDINNITPLLTIEDKPFVCNFTNRELETESRQRAQSFRENVIREKTHTVTGSTSNYSLNVIPGFDTGALYISSSTDDMPITLKGSLGSLFGNWHSQNINEAETSTNIIRHTLTSNKDELETKQDNVNKRWLDISLLKDIRFFTFSIGISMYTLSFQASYVFIPALAIQNHMTHIEAAYIVSIAGALETAGSILSGPFLDLTTIKPHRLNIYNAAMIILGILTFLMPILPSFWPLSCGMWGFTDLSLEVA